VRRRRELLLLRLRRRRRLLVRKRRPRRLLLLLLLRLLARRFRQRPLLGQRRRRRRRRLLLLLLLLLRRQRPNGRLRRRLLLLPLTGRVRAWVGFGKRFSGGSIAGQRHNGGRCNDSCNNKPIVSTLVCNNCFSNALICSSIQGTIDAILQRIRLLECCMHVVLISKSRRGDLEHG